MVSILGPLGYEPNTLSTRLILADRPPVPLFGLPGYLTNRRPKIDSGPRGVTVITLDAESSDRVSTPREAFLPQRVHTNHSPVSVFVR